MALSEVAREKKREYAKAWRTKHPEIVRAQKRASWARNRTKNLLRKRAYYAEHRVEDHARSKAYRATHREEVVERNRRYRLEHHQTIIKQQQGYHKENYERRTTDMREYHVKNRARILRRKRAYRLEHLEEIRTKHQEYCMSHQEELRESRNMSSTRRRARLKNAPINDLTKQQWLMIKQHYKYQCVYCGKKLKKLTMDHITPLRDGGTHTFMNIVPACMPCNRKKYIGPPLKPVQPLLLLEV